MDGLQIHLLVNHIPVIGIPIGLMLAVGGFLFKWEAVRRTGVVVFLATGLFVFPANFTGEDAEDIVEDNAAWVSHDQIHEHEEQAETAMNISVAGLALALLHLFNWPAKQSIRNIIFGAFIVVGIVASTLIGLAAHEGGKIMRPHLGGAVVAPPTGAETNTTPPAGQQQEAEDDD